MIGRYLGKCQNCCGNLYEYGLGEARCNACENIVPIVESEKGLKNTCGIEIQKNINGEYESAFDKDIIKMLKNEDVYNKAELALFVGDWNYAMEYSNELLRRDPTDYKAYLIALLVDLQIKRKEDIIYLNISFRENKNFIHLMDLAPESLYKEFKHYSETVEKNIEIEEKEKLYVNACIRFKHAVTEADYLNIIRIFESLNDYKDSAKYYDLSILSINKLNRRRKKNKFLKIFIPLVIALSIILGCVIKKIRHDVSNISVKITGIESEFDSGASHYNGKYYIYFDYEIENNTDVDIEYICIITYFDDKNGSCVGTLNSSFGGKSISSSTMNLEKGNSKTYETYLSEYSVENSSFFSKIYGKDISDFKISYEITAVEFSDGEYFDGD